MQLAKLVGLEKVLATQVGSAYVRGISGGERRRVSLAEVLATCPRSVIYRAFPVCRGNWNVEPLP